MFRVFMLLILAMPLVQAERIIPPANMFRDPQFLKAFVGSYGILSDVEPRVNNEERALLTRVREHFVESRFREAEQEIVSYVKMVEETSEEEDAAESISPALVFVLGNLYFQADRPEDARRSFLEAIRRYPRFRRAWTNLGYLHISQNKMDEALPALQKAIELGEGSARVFGLLGYCHLLRKNPVAAENAYRQAYLLDANSRDWKLGLAQALIAQSKFAEGASLIGTLIEENANDKQLWLQQTNAYLAMERKDDAAVNLEILRLKGLADESNLNLLGNLYMDREEPQLALNAYLAAIDKASELDVERAMKSARILNDYGFPEKAGTFIAKIREKVGQDPSKEVAVSLLLTEVRVAQTKEDTDRAGELLAELLELDPANGQVLLEMARHQAGLARNEQDEEKRATLVAEAKTNYELAIRDEDQDIAYSSHLGLGQMLVRERRYQDALSSLERALGIRKRESLEQYVSRVRRAADRQKQREEREAAEP